MTKPGHPAAVTLLLSRKCDILNRPAPHHARCQIVFLQMIVASMVKRGYGTSMSIIDHDSTVIVKTREFCAQIASDPMFLKLQASIERFLNDDSALNQYQNVNARGEDLNQKQQAGIQLGASEIREFEEARDALLENDVARVFLEAQRELESLQKEMRLYIGLTLELGRVPTADDLAEASHKGGACCGGGGGGGGCGCSC
jgi:cell fate (sporulation/competence/biofilm development) regulator YlbF (YheA/YmcA/DUF963 family)